MQWISDERSIEEVEGMNSIIDISIIQRLCMQAGYPLQTYQHVSSIDSTNRAMSDLLLAADAVPGWHLLIADQQTHGRGQFGKSWISPANGNWYFSLGRLFAQNESSQVVDSKMIGQFCLETLQSLGVCHLTLKLPNDILFLQSKLAGILIEHHWIGQRCYASVVGVGINVLSHADMQQINQPWTCLQQALPLEQVNAEQWLAQLVIAMMRSYA